MSTVFKYWSGGAIALTFALISTPVMAQPQALRFSEVLFDTPGDPDVDEYVEVYAPTANYNFGTDSNFDYFFVEVENEGSAGAGIVDQVVELNGQHNTNYLVLAAVGGTSCASEHYALPVAMENSGATWFLIAVDENEDPPAIGQDWDESAGGFAVLGNEFDDVHWEILDSIGVIAETDDACASGRLYAPVNFIAGIRNSNLLLPNGASCANTDQLVNGSSTGNPGRGAFSEIEHVFRSGSGGSGDWNAANVRAAPSACQFEVAANSNSGYDEPETIESDDATVNYIEDAVIGVPGTANPAGSSLGPYAGACGCD